MYEYDVVDFGAALKIETLCFSETLASDDGFTRRRKPKRILFSSSPQ